MFTETERHTASRGFFMWSGLRAACLKWRFFSISVEFFIIGIKHGFSCINIRQVSRKVLKTEAGGRGSPASVFDTSLGTWRTFMHWKTMFDRYYCIKTENICYISRYFLRYFVSPFTYVPRTQFPRTMLVLGPGSTHLVTAANLWPRYNHIESCVAVH